MLKLGLIILGIIGCVNIIFAGDDNCPTIKLKRQWGGKLATDLTYQVRPIQYVVIHHTGADNECSSFIKCSEIVKNIQYFHMNELKFDDIGYNFLIGNDGIVYEGAGWGIRGSHTYGYNMNGTGISFIGNYIEKLPTSAALNAAKQLLNCGVKSGELGRNYRLLAGSQVISTQSPGLTLYNEIQNWDHWTQSP